MPETIRLQTSRLWLRVVQPSDAEPIVTYLQEMDIAMNTLSIPYPYTQQHAQDFIYWASQRQTEQPTLALERQTDGQLLGLIGLVPEPNHRRVQLGYWLGKPHWRQGYMSEAARRLVAYVFDMYPDMQRVYAECFTYNIGSARVMQKAGMTFEGTLRQHAYHALRGENMDLHYYGILRETYEAQAGAS